MLQEEPVPWALLNAHLPVSENASPEGRCADTEGAPAGLGAVEGATGTEGCVFSSLLRAKGPPEVPSPATHCRWAQRASPAEIRERHRFHSEIRCYSLQFNISPVNPVREKATQPDSDIVPLITGSRGVPKHCSHLHGSSFLCLAVATAPQGARVNARLPLDSQPFPEASSAGLQRRQAPRCAPLWGVCAAWLRGLPSGLKQSARPHATTGQHPGFLSSGPSPEGRGGRLLLFAGRSGALPASVAAAAPPLLTSAAQTPLQPSGTAFLCLHLINSPSHFKLPQKMSLFSSVSLAPWPKIPVCLDEYTGLGGAVGVSEPRGAGGPGTQELAFLAGRRPGRPYAAPSALPSAWVCPSASDHMGFLLPRGRWAQGRTPAGCWRSRNRPSSCTGR